MAARGSPHIYILTYVGTNDVDQDNDFFIKHVTAPCRFIEITKAIYIYLSQLEYK